MKDERLREIELRSASQHDQATAEDLGDLIAEIRRLRALVKSANAIQPCVDTCPWCVGLVGEQAIHEPECPAFTPDGEAR